MLAQFAADSIEAEVEQIVADAENPINLTRGDPIVGLTQALLELGMAPLPTTFSQGADGQFRPVTSVLGHVYANAARRVARMSDQPIDHNEGTGGMQGARHGTPHAKHLATCRVDRSYCHS